MTDEILIIRNLKKYFETRLGTLHAVDDVSFKIKRGETLGLVGESGCGKSTIGRLILGLQTATSGEILFNGKDVCKMSKQELKNVRKDLQIIFQDPFSSLNPRMSVSEIIREPLQIHNLVRGRAESDKEGGAPEPPPMPSGPSPTITPADSTSKIGRASCRERV